MNLGSASQVLAACSLALAGAALGVAIAGILSGGRWLGAAWSLVIAAFLFGLGAQSGVEAAGGAMDAQVRRMELAP